MNKKTIFVVIVTLLCLPFFAVAQSFTKYVNPLVGTGAHGHTFPGALVPFGAVQLSPDTRLSGWDGCSGYHYDDNVVYGFSHTHLSGTGCSDYGDILIMPFTGTGSPVNSRYCSTFSHGSEVALPGYYAVTLENSGVRAELTATGTPSPTTTNPRVSSSTSPTATSTSATTSKPSATTSLPDSASHRLGATNSTFTSSFLLPSQLRRSSTISTPPACAPTYAWTAPL